MTDKQMINNFIMCSSCDFVLDCRERGQHTNCIKYKPREGEKDGRQKELQKRSVRS